jgi:hypothetical protein
MKTPPIVCRDAGCLWQTKTCEAALERPGEIVRPRHSRAVLRIIKWAYKTFESFRRAYVSAPFKLVYSAILLIIIIIIIGECALPDHDKVGVPPAMYKIRSMST